jgi:Domain of unknown function (DUF4157)
MVAALAHAEPTQLGIGSKDDESEREADQVAAVLTAPQSAVPTCLACGDAEPCPACANARAAVGGPVPLRRAESPALAAESGAVRTVADSLGQASPSHERPYFEKRLGGQRSLQVAAANNPAEYAADATAEQVVRKAGSYAYTQGHGQTVPDASVRRVPSGAGMLSDQPLPARTEEGFRRLAQGGEPLPATLRARFELGFGMNLSGVRIHRDTEAADLSRSIGARAFSLGSHVGFAADQWAPGTAEGDRLIAHELTHVAQASAEDGTTRRSAAGAPHSSVSSRFVRRQPAETDGVGDLVGGLVSAGTEFVEEKVGGLVSAGTEFVEEKVGGLVSAGTEFVEEQYWALVRQVAPRAEPYLREPSRIWTEITGAISSGINDFVNETMAPIRNFDPVGILLSLVGPLIDGVQSMFQSDGDCTKFFKALSSMRERLRGMTPEWLSQAGALFDRISRAVRDAVGSVATEGWKLLERFGGGVYRGIVSLGTELGQLWIRLRTMAGTGSDWVLRQLGLTGPNTSEGILGAIKRRATTAWDDAKPRILPWAGRLADAGKFALLFSPLGPMIAAFRYGPRIVRAIEELYEYLHVPERLIAARTKLAGILPRLGRELQTAALGLSGFVDAVATRLDGGALVLDELAANLGTSSLLRIAADAVRTAAGRLHEGSAWLSGEAEGGFQAIAEFLKRAAHWATSIGETALTLALLVANPGLIPVLLAGELWLRLPFCFKLPVLDWILGLLIDLVRGAQGGPLLGPSFDLFRHAIIGFLERVRGGKDPGARDGKDLGEKVRVSDRIARLPGGIAQFALGLAWGLVKGVGEGLLMPFTLIYDLIITLPKLVDFVETLPEQIARKLRSTFAWVRETAGGLAKQFWDVVQKQINAPGGGVMQLLRTIWAALTGAAEHVGGAVASALISFIMLSDFDLGEKLGWVAGMVLFEVVLAYVSGGTSVLLESASVPLRALGKVLNLLVRAHEIMNQVFGLVFKVIGELVGPLLEMLGKFPGLAAIGATIEALFRRIAGVLEPLMAGAERAGVRAAGGVAGEDALAAALARSEGYAAAATGAEVKEATGAGAEVKEATGEGAEAKEATGAGAEVEEAVLARGNTESVDMTRGQLAEDLSFIERNPELIESGPPRRAQIGNHTWIENPRGWCRYSATPICVVTDLNRAAELATFEERLQAAETRAAATEERLNTLRQEAVAAQNEASENLQIFESYREDLRKLEIEAAELRGSGRNLADVERKSARMQQNIDEAERLATASDAEATKKIQAANEADATVQRLRKNARDASSTYAKLSDNVAKIDALEAQLKSDLVTKYKAIRPPTTSEWAARERELAALKADLSNDMYRARGLTDDVRKALRAGTPSSAASSETLRTYGSMNDFYTGNPIVAPDIVTVDHIVPVDRILEMEGFAQLTEAQQRAILEKRGNLRPASGSLNYSRGKRSFREWFAGGNQANRVPVSQRQPLIDLEAQLEKDIRREIEKHLTGR